MQKETLLKAYTNMMLSKAYGSFMESKPNTTYQYFSNRGHEAIQTALGMNLLPNDWLFPYYRDIATLTACGVSLQQLWQSAHTPFVMPTCSNPQAPHIFCLDKDPAKQVAAAIGVATGIKRQATEKAIAVCSLGDAAFTKGIIHEALQLAQVHNLPIVWVVQDNGWCQSLASSQYVINNNLLENSAIHSIKKWHCDGTDFLKSYQTINEAFSFSRNEHMPCIVYAKVPLLGNHSLQLRKEYYRNREELLKHAFYDPLPKTRMFLLGAGFNEAEFNNIEVQCEKKVSTELQHATTKSVSSHTHPFKKPSFKSPTFNDLNKRTAQHADEVYMIEAAVLGMAHLLEHQKQVIAFGVDTGNPLGGIIGETAGLSDKYTNHVFSVVPHHGLILGMAFGLSLYGYFPIVHFQTFTNFTDAFELVHPYLLSLDYWGVQTPMHIRIQYNESLPQTKVLQNNTSLKQLVVFYPTQAADIIGMLNYGIAHNKTVITIENQLLQWGKLQTKQKLTHKLAEPNYVINLNKPIYSLHANLNHIQSGNSVLIITYGVAAFWCADSAEEFNEQIEIVDLKCLHPLPTDWLLQQTIKHSKVILAAAEADDFDILNNIAFLLASDGYHYLDAPPKIIITPNQAKAAISMLTTNIQQLLCY